MGALKSRLRSQKGQSLVEFALVVPILIVILFSIIEFGRLWETVNILTSAAREGSRVAAVNQSLNDVNVSRAVSAAQNVLTAGHIDNATISVLGPNSTDEVTVVVSMSYTPITGSIIPGISSFSISRSTTMHWEG